MAEDKKMSTQPNNQNLDEDIDVVSVVEIKFAPYQRGQNREQISQMASAWDFKKCDPITVSRRKDGTDYCIDGQHRVLSAMKAGEPELLARVLTGLTYEQEADLFYQAQKSRRAMRPTDAWNASLEAKHSNTVEINTIVDSLGGKVNKNPSNDHGINCPGQLWKIHEYAGPKVLYGLLDVIADAWPSYKLGGPASEARMLGGMMFFVFNHGDEFKRERLVKNLGAAGPLRIRETGQRYRDLGRKLDEGFYLAILDIYNKGLRDESKLSPKKCDWRTVKAATKRAQYEEKSTRRRTR